MQHALRKNWLSILMTALLIVAPFNLFWQIPLGSAYIAGLRIDYLIPKLYLSWLLTVIIIVLSEKKRFNLQNFSMVLAHIKNNTILFLLSGSLLIHQFFTDRPASAVIHFIWLITIGFLVWSLATQRAAKTSITLGSWLSLALQLFVGWWQLLHQHSLAPYYWLGETNLTNWFGITRGMWLGREVILPYGTTAHPNILANTVVVLWWLGWLDMRKELRSFEWKNGTAQLKLLGWILLTLLSLGLIIASQSLSALLAAGFALILALTTYFKPTISKKLLFIIAWLAISAVILTPIALLQLQPVAAHLANSLSWSRRNELFSHAITTLLQHPLWGTGFTQSIIPTSRVGGTSEIVRFVQPVHNVFWLVIVEGGVVGVLGILLIFRKLLRRVPKLVRTASLGWLLLIPAAALDHFWFSQWPGILLAGILLSLSHRDD